MYTSFLNKLHWKRISIYLTIEVNYWTHLLSQQLISFKGYVCVIYTYNIYNLYFIICTDFIALCIDTAMHVTWSVTNAWHLISFVHSLLTKKIPLIRWWMLFFRLNDLSNVIICISLLFNIKTNKLKLKKKICLYKIIVLLIKINFFFLFYFLLEMCTYICICTL